jgi:hypothetical protein
MRALLLIAAIMLSCCAGGPGGVVQNLSTGRILSVRAEGASDGRALLDRARALYPPVADIVKRHGQPSHLLEDSLTGERKVVLFYLARGQGFLCVQQRAGGNTRYRIVGPTELGPKNRELLRAIDALELSTR